MNSLSMVQTAGGNVLNGMEPGAEPGVPLQS